MADSSKWVDPTKVDPTKVDPTKNTKVVPDREHPGKFIEVEQAPKKTYRQATVGGEKSRELPPNSGVVSLGEFKYSGKR